MTKMPKVSIIVPVFNVESYLNQSIESLRNQSLEDIEIICVDDSSNDNSFGILKDYEKKDKRIKVFQIDHKNAASARNRGLEEATGKYIGFVDPDDWVDSCMYEKLYRKIEENNCEIVISQAVSYHENRLFFKYTRGTYRFKGVDKTFFNKPFCALDLGKRAFKLPVSCQVKLFSRKFIEQNNIKFPDIDTSEDQQFFVHTLVLAKKIICLDEFLYYYRKKRKGSHSFSRSLHAKDAIKVFYQIEQLLEQLQLLESFKFQFLSKYARSSLKWYQKADKSVKDDYLRELKPQIEHILKKYDKEELKKFLWYNKMIKLLNY